MQDQDHWSNQVKGLGFFGGICSQLCLKLVLIGMTGDVSDQDPWTLGNSSSRPGAAVRDGSQVGLRARGN
jgi:hypothetical protein